MFDNRPILTLYRFFFKFTISNKVNDLEAFYLNVTPYANGYLDNGIKYEPMGVSFDGLAEDIASVNNNKITLSNLNSKLAPILARHDNFAGGECVIKQIYLDKNAIIAPVIFEKTFLLSSLNEYDSQKLELEIVSILDLDKQFPPFACRELCMYEFKDRNCGYVGEASSCDKTFKSCKALDNTTNFGGVLSEDQ